jgi:nitroreductase
MKAFLRGKVQHLQSVNNSSLVIRNIHRIEKGLSMLERKPIFGLDYIEETLQNLKTVITTSSQGQIKWYFDVLDEYFNTLPKEDARVCKIKIEYHKIQKPNVESPKDTFSGPKKISNYVKTSISFEQILEMASNRKSVRFFEERIVPRDLINKAISVGKMAPSACNRQPFKYYVIDDEAKVKKVSEIPMGTKGYSQSIKTFIVIVGNQSNFFDERDRHLIYIDGSLSAMSVIFALETLGLKSCLINWPDIGIKNSQMRKVLNLNEWDVPIVCLAVGYPLSYSKVPYSEKKPMKEIIEYSQK